MKFLLLPILSLYSFSIHAQNVGIGTTTPPYKLTVNTNGIGISQQSTSGLHEIGFFTNESGAYIQTHSPSPMKFAVGNGNAVMTLTTTGRLGIGVSLPTAKLEVNGDAKVNSMSVVDDLTVTGNITISGEGMVRSATSAQLKIKRSQLGIIVAGIQPGVTVTTAFFPFGEDFTSAIVTVGNCHGTDGVGNWDKLLIVPFDVDVVNNRCRFKITNIGNSAAIVNTTWDIVIIGE